MQLSKNIATMFNNHNMYRLALIITVLFVSQEAFSQKLRKSKPLRPSSTEGYVEATVQLNAMNYYGDLPAGLAYTRYGIGLHISRKLSPRTHVRLGLLWGRIEGDDFAAGESEPVFARNLHFRSDIKELSLTATIDLIGSYGKHHKRVGFTPYGLFGIGIFHHNPKAKVPTNLGTQWVELQGLGTEGQGRPGYAQPYSKIQFALPLGLGVRFKMGERFSLSLESAVRFTFFDYLDDVSGEYPDFADLANPLTAVFSNRSLEATAAARQQDRSLDVLVARYGTETIEGANGQTYSILADFRRGRSSRGSTRSNDAYIATGIHLSYIVNVGLKCPQMRW